MLWFLWVLGVFVSSSFSLSKQDPRTLDLVIDCVCVVCFFLFVCLCFLVPFFGRSGEG